MVGSNSVGCNPPPPVSSPLPAPVHSGSKPQPRPFSPPPAPVESSPLPTPVESGTKPQPPPVSPSPPAPVESGSKPQQPPAKPSSKPQQPKWLQPDEIAKCEAARDYKTKWKPCLDDSLNQKGQQKGNGKFTLGTVCCSFVDRVIDNCYSMLPRDRIYPRWIKEQCSKYHN